MVRKAIVLGSNGPSWQELQFAETDADRMEVALSTRCDFEVERLPSDLDYHEIQKRVADAAAACTSADTLMVYFSGHGELLRGRLYLLLSGTKPSIFDSAINAHYLLDSLQFSEASNKLLILDCCHAGRAAGFKGSEQFPEELKAGSELILCASDHLERTRELDEIGAGFMTHHMCSILEAPRPASMTLIDLAVELKRRAAIHNAREPKARVPLPYLFGSDRSTFVIKKPKGPAPVFIHFDGVDNFNATALFETIRPYLKWNTTERVPFEIRFPQEFSERIQTMSSYLETDQWPCKVDDRTKDQVRTLRDQVFSGVEQDLIRVVRLIMTMGALDDKSDLSDRAKMVLDTYIRAKMTSLKRVLSSYWLINEPDAPWRIDVRELDSVWSTSLIYGLTLTIATNRTWAFWSDADCHIDDRRVRIFVPQFLGTGDSEVMAYDEETFYRAVVPQVLESRDLQDSSNTYISLVRPYSSFLREIRVRGESIIETESHNFPDGNQPTRARATRVTAEILADHFYKLPEEKRRDFAFETLASSRILKELRKKLLELAPEIEDYLHS
ncbi:caspase family protein [Rhizobium leguminosarum]|uniref:caspase family protein n=1 Tax=Rhizobium leguminosarum TaxID=384 RepID=UPI000FEC6499|nr:caspase family protein [Rhizobium leguminosarum]MBY5666209.1 caspase family protein [Rhizobium leguminosarum]MBY5679507.1 caspase family protein [Rhizobium leguminosarum]RWX33219.1 hypothetical protein EHI43_15225 [Rhizobium leguminosarum]